MEDMEEMEQLTHRNKTRRVVCGGTPIGGGAPVSIQSMTNTATEDIEATAAQILALYNSGADIVRLAAPTINAARGLAGIRARVEAAGLRVPLVADIHFDYKIALEAIAAGADKIRINPGNIGGPESLKAVIDAAGEAGIPIRIGVNSGSIEDDLKELFKEKPAEALAESAARYIALVQGLGFYDIVVSIKSSNVLVNTEAHKLLSARTVVPLHIGITEAGFGEAAIVKSSVGIGLLLAMGIGDTIRVSLTGDPVREITAARNILRAVDLLPGSISLISCPTCGRCRVDLAALCEGVSAQLAALERERLDSVKQGRDIKPVTVALMGCAVNGPGEASHADLGIACGTEGGVYFEKGIKMDFVSYENIERRLIDGLRALSSPL